MRKDRLPYTTCAAPLNGPQGKTKTLYTDHLTLNLRVSLRELFKDFHESPPQYFLWNFMCLSTLEQHDSFNVKTTRFDHLADLQGPPPATDIGRCGPRSGAPRVERRSLVSSSRAWNSYSHPVSAPSERYLAVPMWGTGGVGQAPKNDAAVRMSLELFFCWG